LNPNAAQSRAAFLRQGMIWKNVKRFSDKTMLKQDSRVRGDPT
jgi:hypothetical protein